MKFNQELAHNASEGSLMRARSHLTAATLTGAIRRP